MKMNKVFLILCGMISMVGTADSRSQRRITARLHAEELAMMKNQPSAESNTSSATVSSTTASSSQTDEEKDDASLKEIDVKIVTLTEDITTAQGMQGGPKGSAESKAKSTAFAKAKTDLADIKKDVAALLLEASKVSVQPRIDKLEEMFQTKPKTTKTTKNTKATKAGDTTTAPTTTKNSKKSKKSKTPKTPTTDTTSTAK